MILKFCEFTGDKDHVWDGEKKQVCEHAGFERCILHKQPLLNYLGWRLCCKECKTPIQIKEVPHETPE